MSTQTHSLSWSSKTVIFSTHRTTKRIIIFRTNVLVSFLLFSYILPRVVLSRSHQGIWLGMIRETGNDRGWQESERIEWFIEGQAFLRSYLLLHVQPLPPSLVIKLSLFLSLSVCRRSRLLSGEGRRGWAWSRIIRPQEGLVTSKSRNTLWQGERTEWNKGRKMDRKCRNPTLFLKRKSQRKSHERGAGMWLGCAVKCKYKRLWSNIFSLRLYSLDLLRRAIFETNRSEFFRSKSKRTKIKRIRSRFEANRNVMQRHHILSHWKRLDHKKFKGVESEDYFELR